MAKKTIDSFKGKYRFLSNFYPCPVTVGGLTFPSSEHAFQAMKTKNIDMRRAFVKLPDPQAAKLAGRTLRLRPDWEDVKVGVMATVIRAKFGRNRELAERLIATYPHALVEGNTWGDTFWGVCRGEGKNTLGQILVVERDRLMRLKEKHG